MIPRVPLAVSSFYRWSDRLTASTSAMPILYKRTGYILCNQCCSKIHRKVDTQLSLCRRWYGFGVPMTTATATRLYCSVCCRRWHSSGIPTTTITAITNMTILQCVCVVGGGMVLEFLWQPHLINKTTVVWACRVFNTTYVAMGPINFMLSCMRRGIAWL